MNELQGRTLFIPEMDYGGARVLAAALRRQGLNARVVPPSTKYSNSLAGKCISGDECYPTQITLGDFLAILDQKIVEPEKAAFFMATADGPCRFGQYYDFMRKTLDKLGYKDVPVFSLTSRDAYHSLGNGFERSAWHGIVAADILRKFLHMARPYETKIGETDKIFEESVEEICRIIENPKFNHSNRLKEVVKTLKFARDRFQKIEIYKQSPRILIGVLGEIFCRLNTFSNQDIIRKLEEHGAECWLVGVSEWIFYTSTDEIRRLKEQRKYFTKKYLKAVIKRHILLKDEHEILKHFAEDLKGREECPIDRLLTYSLPYLPWYGSLGEMTLSVAGTFHFQKMGCAGVVDISSFGCMNEIVAEAVFPKVSRELDNFPIKVFYFDGTLQNLDRDIEIFLELARNYRPLNVS